jgi:hypothetical protein
LPSHAKRIGWISSIAPLATLSFLLRWRLGN